MPSNPFNDPAAVAIWNASAAQRVGTMGPSTEVMLDRAGVREGSRVLDVGTGAGDTSLLAAARVGPTGHVLATDPSAAMVAAARRAVATAGVTTIEVRLAGAGEVTDTGFDAVIARNSLQFVPHPEVALARIRASLKPGGRLAAIVWGPLAEDPWMSIPIAALAAVGKAPVSGDSVLIPSSLGDVERLRGLLEGADFSAVVVERVAVRRSFATRDQLWAALEASPLVHLALTGLSSEDQARVVEQMRVAASRVGTEVLQQPLLASGTA